MKSKIFSATIGLLFCIGVSTAKAQAGFDVEAGGVFTGYNDVRIPSNQGTFFSLKDDLSPKTEFFYRLRLNYTINSRHTLSLLYAPFEIQTEGRVSNHILFQDKLFPANTEITGTYKFNSYRLTYRYEIVQNPRFAFGLGLTAKIRDAEIRLSSQGQTAEKINVGFVPIINFRLWWKIDEEFSLLLDGDALAAPQGRAADIQLAAAYRLSDDFTIRAGYRILEGGADNDEVYNFSLFHYASVGLSFTLRNRTR